MRLLKLRFQNINSLAGEYEIDFTNAVLAESGIFAIVGPTGSGKTSILDAVSLALYGETPRTAERPEESKDKAAECQVLTKNRTECYAQVIFEAYGKTWLSRWSRGYGPRSKKLTPEKVELVLLSSLDDEAGRIVAEKITDWKAAVTWLLGMDFAGFTRCVLLAQGAFAKLLRAKVDERASILERITGTELYSEIGRTVYRKEAEDKARVERLEAALAGAAPLSDEARGALEAALQAAQAAEKAAVESRRTANQRLEKRRALDAAAAAYMEAKKRSKAAQAALEAAAPERARAAAARRAAKGARALEEKTRKRQKRRQQRRAWRPRLHKRRVRTKPERRRPRKKRSNPSSMRCQRPMPRLRKRAARLRVPRRNARQPRRVLRKRSSTKRKLSKPKRQPVRHSKRRKRRSVQVRATTRLSKRLRPSVPPLRRIAKRGKRK